MVTEKLVETMDSVGRLSAVAKSLCSWYRFRNDVLRRERQAFRAELQTTSDPAYAAELQAALEENKAEQAALDSGWGNSSVRRHIESRSEIGQDGGMEQRDFVVSPAAPPAVRADSTGTSSRLTAKSLVGYAAKFNVIADLGWFREKIAPGAFAKALPKSDVRLLFNHDSNFIYGRSSAATLELAEDTVGLRFVGYLLPFDPASYALARRIDRRDITGCSFSFIVAKDAWTFARRPGELDERTLIEIEQLFDVGPVTYPAYTQTTCGASFERVQSRAAPPADDVDWQAFFDQDDEWNEVCRQFDARKAPVSAERLRDINRQYRKMGRILGRVKN